jgi:hypothetical protein
VNHVTSDIAGATGDEHGHGPPLLNLPRARTQYRFPLYADRALLRAMLAGLR